MEAQEESVARKYYKVIADHYAHVGELAAAERLGQLLTLPSGLCWLIVRFVVFKVLKY